MLIYKFSGYYKLFINRLDSEIKNGKIDSQLNENLQELNVSEVIDTLLPNDAIDDAISKNGELHFCH